MAWPSGVSRQEYKAWKKKQEFSKVSANQINIDNYLLSIGRQPTPKVIKQDSPNGESTEDPNEHKITIVDENKLYGLSFDDYNVICWGRFIYQEDTTVEYPVKGGMETKTYKKGEYSKWAHLPGAFIHGEKETRLSRAFKTLAEHALRTQIANQNQLNMNTISYGKMAEIVKNVVNSFNLDIKFPELK